MPYDPGGRLRGMVAPPSPPRERYEPPRRLFVVIAIALPVVLFIAVLGSYLLIRDRHEKYVLRDQVAALGADNAGLQATIDAAAAKDKAQQAELDRLRDANKALSAPAVTVRGWIQKEDIPGHVVATWQDGRTPARQDLLDGATYVIAEVTNTGGQAVDLTWYTVEAKRGVTMPKAFTDGPQPFYRRVPIRIQPYSQVSVGIDLPSAAAYARKIDGHYADRLVLLISFAGLADQRAELPFDFAQMPDRW